MILPQVDPRHGVRNVPNTRSSQQELTHVFRTRQSVSIITQDDTSDEEDLEDDEGVQDEGEIWEVTHVSEQELETTEGEGVDFLAELLELVG